MKKSIFWVNSHFYLCKKHYHLRITIPTLNRPMEVEANLFSLIKKLNLLNPLIRIQVLVSENKSDNNKMISDTKFHALARLNTANTVDYKMLRHKIRLGIGEHMHFLSKLQGAAWVMWIGDDDLLTGAYLKFVINTINSENYEIKAIVPGYKEISSKSFFNIAYSEETSENQIDYEESTISSRNAVYMINRGHQLSGLVYRKEIICEALCANLPPCNLYPWMCYQAIALQKGKILNFKGIHAKITNDTPKHFSYRKDGLLPDISEAILCGFPQKHSRGVYFASRVIGEKGGWRIFKTGRTGLGGLYRYIKLLQDERMDNHVFFLSFFYILFRAVWLQTGLRDFKKYFLNYMSNI